MKKLFGDRKKDKQTDLPMKNTLVHRIWTQNGADAKNKDTASQMVVPMPDLSWMDEKDQK